MITPEHSTVFSCSSESWAADCRLLLEQSGLAERALLKQRVLIKPNLVEILAPPITTPVQLVENIVQYLLEYLPPSAIIIGEGCGAREYDTHRA